MDPLSLARWQFALTTVYHFFFVPLTLGLSILVAVMETLYVRTGDEVYKKMTKFWGKLFLINFAVGVVTGLVQEFQFGMNWSEYSRFVGDIFGAPLAIEALLAFFLESTFLGIWIFGWDKLPKALHAGTIWLVALGSNLSAFWILTANSFMQSPVGYVLNGGRAEMNDFGALVTNPYVWLQFPHVFFSGVTTAGFFVLGISAFHLWKESRPREAWQRSFRMAAVYALIGAALVGLAGHTQMQKMLVNQPMKLAAAEALWETEQPAALSLITISDETNRQEVFAIKLPYVMSLLTCNNLTCEIRGINDIQAEYEQIYGPGNYVPSVAISYWSFRGMVTFGMAMGLIALLAVFWIWRKTLDKQKRFLRLFPLAIPLPYLANTGGWLMTETGRQPWIVFGLMKTQDGLSPTVGAGTILFSLLAFMLVYAVLMAVDIYLLAKFARQGMDDKAPAPDKVLTPQEAA